MNQSTKIRVNFKNENIIKDVNMSVLCDVFASKISYELKERLLNTKTEDYHKLFEINSN